MTSLINYPLTLSMTSLEGLKSSPLNMLAYARIFLPVAWTSFLAMAIIVVVAYASLSMCVSDRKKDGNNVVLETLNGMDYVFKSTLQLEASFSSNTLSTRQFLLWTGLLSYIVFSYYNALLTSYMTVKTKNPRIKSYRDVLDSDFKILILRNSPILKDVSSAKPGTIFHEVYHKLIKGRSDAIVSGFIEARDIMLKDPMYMYMGSPALFSHDKRFIALRDLNEAIKTGVSFLVPKDSDLLKAFNSQIFKLRTSGVWEFLSNKWFAKRKPKSTTEEEETSGSAAWALGYSNLFFPSAFLMFGGSLAIVLAFAEKMLQCRGTGGAVFLRKNHPSF